MYTTFLAASLVLLARSAAAQAPLLPEKWSAMVNITVQSPAGFFQAPFVQLLTGVALNGKKRYSF